jgi:XTP/dITP diphosphohydrolase
MQAARRGDRTDRRSRGSRRSRDGDAKIEPVREVLVATTNEGKLREIRRILRDVPVTMKTLADFPRVDAPEETGASFAENARQKAIFYSCAMGIATLAEDSGFEVDALNREPGIYSARYLREEATYKERFTDIYRRLDEIGDADRSARFVCAVAVAKGAEIVFETSATVEGLLAAVPVGPHGFGYDPIFFYPPYGRTFGEVSDDEKTAVSHRGQAMRAFREYLLRT